MGKLKEIAIFILILIVLPVTVSNFCGKRYTKLYPNKSTQSWAVKQFKNICGKSTPNGSDGGVEYSVFYESKGAAINDFMALARSLDGKYANGKFRHLYVSGKERIYQCCDANRKLIALRYKKHPSGFYMGNWESAFYEIQFYIEK